MAVEANHLFSHRRHSRPHSYANTPRGCPEAQCKKGFLDYCRTSSSIKAAYLPAGAGATGAAAEAVEPLAASTHNFLSGSHPFPGIPKLASNNTSFQTSSSDSLLFHPFIFVLGTPSAIRQAHRESE